MHRRNSDTPLVIFLLNAHLVSNTALFRRIYCGSRIARRTQLSTRSRHVGPIKRRAAGIHKLYRSSLYRSDEHRRVLRRMVISPKLGVRTARPSRASTTNWLHKSTPTWWSDASIASRTKISAQKREPVATPISTCTALALPKSTLAKQAPKRC